MVVAIAAALLAGAPSAGAAEAIDFSVYTPRLTATRISSDEAPKIDADLSDPAWAKAAVVDQFYQVEPVEGGTPSQPTRALIMYDEKTLYVGFHLYDSEPEKIRRNLLERDAQLRDDDGIRIMIDSFGTFRDGFFFATNANGARIDALLENNATFRPEWNTIWNVKARVVEDGWIAEFAIPFRSISFDGTLDEWGLQLTRTIRRTNEEIRWSNIDRSRDRIDLTNPGRLSGIENVRAGVGLEAQLFATGATAHDWETGETDFSFDPSANLFYKITPSLTGSLTLNTDFADAPLDERQVNTGRFDLFFPETRDFFLQDAASFEFGGRVFQDNVNGLPFFSRNIGIVDATPVDIVVGAKVSGKAGPANLGALAVKTGSAGPYEGQYLASARASFAVLDESKAGVIFTHGDPAGAFTNTLAGADFQYKNSTRWAGTLYGDFAYIRSVDSDGTETVTDQFAGADIAYRSLKWNWTIRFNHVGDDYRPRLGFTNRTAIRRYNVNGFRTWRPENSFIRFAETGAYASAVTDLDDEALDRDIGGWIGGANHDGDEFWFETYRGFTDIREPFDIAGRLAVPAGEYRYSRHRVELAMTESRRIAFGAEYVWGGIYDGDYRSLDASLSFRPSKHLNVAAEYQLTQFDLPSGELDVHVAIIQSTIAVSPTMFVRSDVQYDNISENFTFLARFSFEPTPEREIFLSLGHTALIEEDRFPQSFRAQGTSLALRLGHTFRM
ncbi:MAG: carbohydrate binding family 9 domain-containing protein [Pseudomonadota bacterium]